MATIILFPRYDEDTQLIWQAAVDRGMDIVRGTPSSDALSEPTGIYGGVMWAERVAKSLGKHLSWPADDWLTTLRYVYKHRDVWKMSGADVKRLAFPKFVKSLNWKSIESRTYFSKDDLPPTLVDDEQFLVSEVVQFASEFRAFMLNGEIETMARYATYGCLDMGTNDGLEDARAFLKTVDVSALPSAVVVDVGFIKDRGWAVVEANPAWCSGMYGHDPQKVLDVVMASTLT